MLQRTMRSWSGRTLAFQRSHRRIGEAARRIGDCGPAAGAAVASAAVEPAATFAPLLSCQGLSPTADIGTRGLEEGCKRVTTGRAVTAIRLDPRRLVELGQAQPWSVSDRVRTVNPAFSVPGSAQEPAHAS